MKTSCKAQILKVISALCLISLLAQGYQWPSKWQEDRTCTKGHKPGLRTCLAERFPPGSDYYQLEAFLIDKGLIKDKVENPNEGNRIKARFRYKPQFSIVNYGVVVIVYHDESFKIIELVVR